MAREWDRETVHCTLRLPDDGLDQRIKELARRHGHSLNAELVRLLRGAVAFAEVTAFSSAA